MATDHGSFLGQMELVLFAGMQASLRRILCPHDYLGTDPGCQQAHPCRTGARPEPSNLDQMRAT